MSMPVLPRFKLVEGSERLFMVGGEVEKFPEGEEVRVPAAVLEGIKDKILRLSERAQLLRLREVRSDRLVDED